MLITDIGIQQVITTLTNYSATVIEEKFYEIENLGDIVPIMPSTATAWLDDVAMTTVHYLSKDRRKKKTNGARNKVNKSDIAYGQKMFPRKIFEDSVMWTDTQLRQAAASLQKINLMKDELQSLKIGFDLEFQSDVFVGDDDINLYGLLNNPEVAVNSDFFTKPIGDFTPDEFNNFIKTLLSLYSQNCNATTLPDTLVLPLSHLLGMVSFVSPEFPINSRIDAIENAFSKAVGRPFKVYGVAYCDKNYGYVAEDRYMLYRNDPKTLEVEVPVPFELINPNTGYNYYYEMIGRAQYSGCNIKRPLEVMAFSVPTTPSV